MRDRWFTAEAAVDYGFLDRVVDGFDEMVPRVPRATTGLQVSA